MVSLAEHWRRKGYKKGFEIGKAEAAAQQMSVINTKDISNGIQKQIYESIMQGIETGRIQMAQEIALDMLDDDFVVNMVEKFTKLPLEKIEELKSSIGL